MSRALLLLAASLLPYLPSLYGEFVYDDIYLMNHDAVMNAKWREIRTWAYWRPLTFLSYIANVLLCGPVIAWTQETAGKHIKETRLALMGFHLGGMLLHALNVLLVWRFFGLSGALVFAVFPLCSQSVANISGRYSVLAGTFGILAVWLTLTGHPAWATLMVLLSCFAKEDHAILFLFVALFGHSWIPLITVGLGVLWQKDKIRELLNNTGAENLSNCGFPQQLSGWTYRITVFVEHLVRLPGWFFGLGLCADHAVKPWTFKRLSIALGIALGMGFAVQSYSWAVLSLALYGFPLIPYLVQPMPNPVMEQRLYLPSLGLALIWGRVPFPCLAVIVCCFIVMTLTRSWYWSSPINLWESSRRDGGREDRALINLAADALVKENYQAARQYSREALALNPNLGQAWLNLAIAEWKTSHLSEAVECVTEAITRTPNYVIAWRMAGYIFEDAKRWDEAADAYHIFIRMDKGTSRSYIWNKLGLLRVKQQNIVEAQKCFEQASRYDKESIAYRYNYAATSESIGLIDKAIEQFRQLPKQIFVTPDMVTVKREQA